MRFSIFFAAAALLGSQALANPQTEAYDFCWDHQVAFLDEGIEMATGPIKVSGESWNITWDSVYTIFGDRLEIPFTDGVTVIEGQTSPMADHVLTIASHRDREIEPFAIRYEKEVYMTIPYPADKNGTEPFCFTLRLSS